MTEKPTWSLTLKLQFMQHEEGMYTADLAYATHDPLQKISSDVLYALISKEKKQKAWSVKIFWNGAGRESPYLFAGNFVNCKRFVSLVHSSLQTHHFNPFDGPTKWSNMTLRLR